MRCFYVPKEKISDNQIRFLNSELHHLMDVVRLRKGDEITVLDGEGGIYDVQLVSLSTNPPIAIGEIRSWKQAELSPIEVTLIQGITKADSMDMIVQKATELGVCEIIPALCQRTVPNFTSDKAQKRVIRWRQIAIESSKQSRRPFFPKIHDIINFNESLKASQADLKLIFIAPSVDFISPKNLKDVLKQNTAKKVGSSDLSVENNLHGKFLNPPNPLFQRGNGSISPFSKGGKGDLRRMQDSFPHFTLKNQKVQVIVGPEGDFTDDEIKYALSIGAIPVSLGSNILRAETASIAGLAIVLYELA